MQFQERTVLKGNDFTQTFKTVLQIMTIGTYTSYVQANVLMELFK